jgi:hypothetical protein
LFGEEENKTGGIKTDGILVEQRKSLPPLLKLIQGCVCTVFEILI